MNDCRRIHVQTPVRMANEVPASEIKLANIAGAVVPSGIELRVADVVNVLLDASEPFWVKVANQVEGLLGPLHKR